jgi:hypothetical protein
VGAAQGQCEETLVQDGKGFPRYRLQRVALVRLFFGPPGGDVGYGDDHEVWFVTNPVLCD